MTREEWQQVKKVLNNALEIPRAERQRGIDDDLIRLDPVAVSYRYSLSEAYENLGRVALLLGQKERGRTLLRDALKVYDELQARGAVSAEYAGVPARIQKGLREAQ